jgi:sugar fermentation stimulation protein A
VPRTRPQELVLPHRLPGPPVEAVLVERENRFRARCALPDGREMIAHVPDRGRLAGVLVPGARVWLFEAPPSPTRTTRWSLLGAREPASGTWVAIDPAGANLRVRPLLERGLFNVFGLRWNVRAEVPLGRSRIDFLLSREEQQLALEVKSVGVVRGGVARFPDAPTERGTRHVEELAAWVGDGRLAAVLFVVQRGDAVAVTPDDEIDPAFAAAVRRHRDAITWLGVKFEIRPDGCVYRGSVPVLVDGASSRGPVG